MKFKKWTFSFLAAAALIFSFVAVFNYLVDPYRIYDTDIFKNKPREDLQSRFMKVVKIQKISPTSIKKIESGYMAELKRDEVSRLSYENFIEILTDAHENNITLDIAISPLHARLLEAMDYRVGLDAAWYEWKKQIATVNEEVAKRLEKSRLG